MGLYNFKEKFVARILSGEKTHTIRPRRARADKPGNTLHLYTGLRHKGARLLMRVPCVKVEDIEMDACGHECNCDATVVIDGVDLDAGERDAFAVRDGFEDFADMLDFWVGRLPFKGHVIHWEYKP
jgi:uncharacterized protein YqfB (UPF0267 family)